MAKTRIYEVGTTVPKPGGGEVKKTFLVDAVSGPAAWKHVAEKFVGAPTLPDGRRIAELMKPGPDQVVPEQAKEDA